MPAPWDPKACTMFGLQFVFLLFQFLRSLMRVVQNCILLREMLYGSVQNASSVIFSIHEWRTYGWTMASHISSPSSIPGTEHSLSTNSASKVWEGLGHRTKSQLEFVVADRFWPNSHLDSVPFFVSSVVPFPLLIFIQLNVRIWGMVFNVISLPSSLPRILYHKSEFG